MIEIPQFTHNDYEIIEREVMYQGVFRLVRYQMRNRLFKGGWSEVFKREVFERFSAAAVLPYDPILDRVILIEQFRPGSLSEPKSPWLIEIPAGVLVGDAKPQEVAHREVIEEAGCEVHDLYPICEYFASPGACNEYLYIYCGRVDASHAKGVYGLKHEHEDILVLNLSTEEAFTKLYAGEIKTSPALISLLWLQLHRKKLQTMWV